MDPLTRLFDGRSEAPGLEEIVVTPPWSVVIPRSAHLAVVIVDGESWCHTGESAAFPVTTGDLGLLALREDVVVGSEEAPAARPAGRADGVDPAGTTRVLIRTYPLSERTDVFDALPPLRRGAGDADAGLWGALLQEVRTPRPARLGVIGRYIDLLFIEAVRAWSAGPHASGWLRASLDPVVGAALELFHDDPEYPWTLHEIAARVGTTRTSLSRRFQILLGEPPMTYLKRWRMDRAADHLRDPRSTIADAARLAGFDDSFTFAAAFARRYGVSPARFRLGGDPASAGAS